MNLPRPRLIKQLLLIRKLKMLWQLLLPALILLFLIPPPQELLLRLPPLLLRLRVC
jgi:hypothetical protein